MRLGIGSYTFPWAVGLPGAMPEQSLRPIDLLEAAARLQVGVVQFCDNLPLTQLSEAELAALQGYARKLGLELELGTRGLAPVNLHAHFRLAQRFGCRFLRLVIDSPGDEPTPAETVARLREFSKEFKGAGMRLAIENHDRFDCRTLARMVEQLGPDWAGICLDTVNSLGALEGPEVVVANLAPFTLCLHLKDFTIRRPSHQMGFLVEGCAAGRGRLDVQWLLESLRVSPHPFNVILETWVTPGASLAETIGREREWADEGVRNLRKFIVE